MYWIFFFRQMSQKPGDLLPGMNLVNMTMSATQMIRKEMQVK